MRMIDADTLNYVRVRIYHDDGTIGGYNAVVPSSEIKNAPTVDAQPVRHGRWIGAESQCGIGCPFCGTPVDDFCNSIDYIYLIYEPNYCPNCGAKMDGTERKYDEID